VASLNNVGILEAAAVLPTVGPEVALNHLQGVDTDALGVLKFAHLITMQLMKTTEK